MRIYSCNARCNVFTQAGSRVKFHLLAAQSKTSETKASQQSFYQPRCFCFPLIHDWWQQWMWRPLPLTPPWHEITAPALTDNTYRIFASLTSWRISIKTPLCSSGWFCHRQRRRARMNTHSVWKWGAQRMARSQTLLAELWFLLCVFHKMWACRPSIMRRRPDKRHILPSKSLFSILM